MRKLLVFFVLLVVIAVLSAAAGILLSGGRGPLLGDTLLVWKVDQPIVDHRPSGSFLGALVDSRQSLGSLYRAFAEAREDAGVTGVEVVIHNARFGLATAQELRALLATVREAGKTVECYLETAGEGGNGTLAYYLATACDSISLAPAGEINLLGLYADGVFLRGSLDKLRIAPYFSHVGDYKSAGEIFTETEHSPAAEEAISAVLDAYYSLLLEEIGQARGMPIARLETIFDGAPYTAAEARQLGLVDRLAYPDELREDPEGPEPRNRLRIEDYRVRSATGSGPGVAVVFAQGAIVRGAGGIDPWTEQRAVGSTDTVELLDQLADRDEIRGVVLRIDSPGGSAQASDLILRAVERLGRVKPVVVSMADVAASGGYYIAARADRIVASPATLTGSIGVVGGKLVTRRFQQELLGISHDTLKRGANADIFSPLEPFSPAQQESFERLMRTVYRTFVEHVAEGREMEIAAVEEVAGGRIWSGSAALERGLVDRLGGLDQALEEVREAAGIEPGARLDIEYLPRAPGLLEEIRRAQASVRANPLEDWMRELEGGTRPMLELPPELASLAAPF
jgi:protease-4